MNWKDEKNQLAIVGVLVIACLLIAGTKDYNILGQLFKQIHHRNGHVVSIPQVQAQPVQPPVIIRLPVVQPPPVYVPPKQWPQELTPTRFIRVPNPDNPSLGVINEFVSTSDDVEVDIEPEWIFGYNSLPSDLQMAIDDGSGFQSLNDFANQHPAYGANTTDLELLKRKTIRYRLRPGSTGTSMVGWILSHKRFEKPKEYVPPEGKKAGSLSVAVTAFRPLETGGFRVDLEFKNTGDKTPIAVALHSTENDKSSMWNRVATSLVDSSGREYVLSEMTGVNCLSTAPQNLTEIDAGESLSATLKFPSSMPSTAATSFSFQVEIVENANYDANSYSSYQPQNGVLPPNCKTHNVSFQIPLTQK
jgi:hypothetical protein